MKYYIIAGEQSGDLHGSNLILELKRKDKDAQFRVWGGDLMANQGATIVKHIDTLAFMGFVEVVRNLPVILNNIKLCKNDILSYKPDVVIFIDYPGFNLRIAKFAKKNNLRTIYYISPQVWAWHKSRVKTIKSCIDKMLVILPFEKDFYAKHDYDVSFVGHPLLDAIDQYSNRSTTEVFRNDTGLGSKPLVALLPGSRAQEISRMLRIMTSIIKEFPEYQFVIAGVSSHSENFYNQFIDSSDVKLVFGQTYPLLYNAEAAIVASGTATLETALIGTPQIVCYRGSSLSYRIAKYLVDIKFISLVNLIMDKQVVCELIQNDFTGKKVAGELQRLLHDKNYSENIKNDYCTLRSVLGGKGASEKAAEEIVQFLRKQI